MTLPPLPNFGRLQRRLTIIGLVGMLLRVVPAHAGVTTIDNIYESTDAFLTEVHGSVGFFFPISILSDIPGTPWESTSRIVEVPGVGPFPDAMSVSWTMQHLVGPDPTDINPNPLEPVTLTLGFIATAAGSFGVGVGGTPPIACLIPPPAPSVINIQTVNHPLTTGGVHFDEFCLNLFGTVNTNLVGGFRIVSYTIDYIAYHCDVLNPTLVGCPATLAGIGGMTAPEPSTLVLVGLGLGLVILVPVHKRRRQTLLSSDERQSAGGLR